MIGRSKGLVIVYKDIEHEFQGIPDVEADHGDIAGDDTHRDDDFRLVIGGKRLRDSELPLRRSPPGAARAQ